MHNKGYVNFIGLANQMAPFGRDIMYTVVYLPFWHKLKIFFDFVKLLKLYLLFMPKF